MVLIKNSYYFKDVLHFENFLVLEFYEIFDKLGFKTIIEEPLQSLPIILIRRISGLQYEEIYEIQIRYISIIKQSLLL